jgi:outer membrane protein assembly factor BamB
MDINRVLLGTLGDSIGASYLYDTHPEFLWNKNIASGNRVGSAIILFDDESYAYGIDNTQVVFNDLSGDGPGWTKTIGTGVNNAFHGSAYNPVYDYLVFCQNYGASGYGQVTALDRITGTKVWSYDTPSSVIVFDCSVDENGDVYIAAGQDGLIKLNGETGSLIWSKTGIMSRCISCDSGLIGGINGVVVVGFAGGGENVFFYTSSGSLVWTALIPSYEAGLGYEDLSSCRIYGSSQDVLVAGNKQDAGAAKTLWRLNGGNGGLIWDLDLGGNSQVYVYSLPFPSSYGKCIDYDDFGNIWCGVQRNNNLDGTYFRLAKISPSGSIIDKYEFGGVGLGPYPTATTPHIAIQVSVLRKIATTTPEPSSTTTEEPYPCEVSNLFEYGYVEKDGVRILIRETVGNEIRLIRPIPPEWTVGSELKLVPGCNKTLCDCFYKWNNLTNFHGLGIKMPSSNPLVDDTGANPS